MCREHKAAGMKRAPSVQDTDENTDGDTYHFSGRRPLSTQVSDLLQGAPEKRWCLTGQARACEVGKD